MARRQQRELPLFAFSFKRAMSATSLSDLTVRLLTPEMAREPARYADDWHAEFDAPRRYAKREWRSFADAASREFDAGRIYRLSLHARISARRDGNARDARIVYAMYRYALARYAFSFDAIYDISTRCLITLSILPGRGILPTIRYLRYAAHFCRLLRFSSQRSHDSDVAMPPRLYRL